MTGKRWRPIHRVLLAALTLGFAGGALGLAPQAHAATVRNGVCETGEFCYYYNSGQAGSVWDFNVSLSVYTSSTTFVGAGAGKGQPIANNAASVRNLSPNTVRVWTGPSYTGSYQDIAPLWAGNLTTAYNKDQSHQFLARPTLPTSSRASTSYYIQAFDENWATTQGCALGKLALNTSGTQRFIVILDFGYMYQSSTGAWMMAGYDKSLSLAQAGTMVYDFGQYFWSCAGADHDSKLYVGLGTQTSRGKVTAQAGAALAAQVVSATNKFASAQGSIRQSYAAGANDFESWGHGPTNDTASRAWFDGYMAYTGRQLFFNYGSADGCPPVGTACNPGLTAATIRHVSWDGSAFPVPEIYNNGWMAAQWKALSAGAANGPFIFQATLSQQGACAQRGCSGTDNSPQTAWSQLATQLQSGGGTLHDSATDIKYQIK